MQAILYASLISLVLVLCTVAMHYWVLAGLSHWFKKNRHVRGEIFIAVLVMFVAHALEISLYGWVYFLLDTHNDAMNLGGFVEGSALDHLYFSAACYTSLGLGDLYPTGTLRLLAGIEALNGLVLITWSASFAFLVMQRRWKF